MAGRRTEGSRQQTVRQQASGGRQPVALRYLPLSRASPASADLRTVSRRAARVMRTCFARRVIELHGVPACGAERDSRARPAKGTSGATEGQQARSTSCVTVACQSALTTTDLGNEKFP